MTVFVGSGFTAKYPEGGGVFSVPLQWMLGLRRLGLDAVWLEILPATDDKGAQTRQIDTFRRRLRDYGLEKNFCLLRQKSQATRMISPTCVVWECHDANCSDVWPAQILCSTWLTRFIRRSCWSSSAGSCATSIRVKFFIG